MVINKIFNTKYFPVLLFCLAFIIRFVWVYIKYRSNVMINFSDDKGYFDLAVEIIKNGKILYSSDLHLYASAVGPGLLWILSIIILIFGDSWLAIFFISSIISALIPVGIYYLSKSIFSLKVAVFASLYSCFYIWYVLFSATSGKDIWMSFFLLLSIYLLVSLFERKRFTYIKFIFLTFIFAFSFHFDERFLIFTPILLLYIIFSESIFYKKVSLTKALFFIILIVIFSLPWTIRNSNEYDKIVIVSTRIERFTDKIFGYTTKESPFDDLYKLKGRYYIYPFQIDSIIDGSRLFTDGGYRISEEQRNAMKSGLIPEPLSNLDQILIRLNDFIFPIQIHDQFKGMGYTFVGKSQKRNLLYISFYVPIFVLSFIGFYYLHNHNKRIFWLFLSIIIVYTVLHVFLIPFTTHRYRLPLDFIFIIVGWFGFFELLKRLQFLKGDSGELSL